MNRSIKLIEIDKSFVNNNLNMKENMVSITIAKINFVFMMGIRKDSKNKPNLVLLNINNANKRAFVKMNAFFIPTRKDNTTKTANVKQIKIRPNLLSDRFSFMPKKSDKNLKDDDDNKICGTYGEKILSENFLIKLLSKIVHKNFFANKIIFKKEFKML